MIAALAPLFVGDLASYRDALVTMDDVRPSVPLRRLLERAEFDRVLQVYGAAYEDGDRRAVASEWSKRYFIRLLPPVLAADLLLNHSLPLDIHAMEVVLGRQGEPLAFKLPSAGGSCTPLPGDPFSRFSVLLDDHLAPLIQAWGKHARLSPRVFWSNAANYVEWLLSRIGTQVAIPPMDDARAMLAWRQRIDGRPNPLYKPVRYRQLEARAGVPAREWRQRRVCCVRYLLPDKGLCTNCPLLGEPTDDAAADSSPAA